MLTWLVVAQIVVLQEMNSAFHHGLQMLIVRKAKDLFSGLSLILKTNYLTLCKEHYLKPAYPRARNRNIWVILSEEERSSHYLALYAHN
jgi:hypothetical protein